jgi:hypothetical protein
MVSLNQTPAAFEGRHMAITRDDLAAFHHFAETAIASRDADSLHELVDIWEAEHPTAEIHSQNVSAVRAAIRDMELGDSGQPAQNVVDELRLELASRRAL